tara:strand:- start:1 stop:330 length:330 start_codon:yes stop_codon:yes gene_type:complete
LAYLYAGIPNTINQTRGPQALNTQKEYDSKNRLTTITVRLDDATDLRCTFHYSNNVCHTRVFDDYKRGSGGLATLICQPNPQKGLVAAMNHIKSFEKRNILRKIICDLV